jgi:hypothetical protein
MEGQILMQKERCPVHKFKTGRIYQPKGGNQNPLNYRFWGSRAACGTCPSGSSRQNKASNIARFGIGWRDLRPQHLRGLEDELDGRSNTRVASKSCSDFDYKLVTMQQAISEVATTEKFPSPMCGCGIMRIW